MQPGTENPSTLQLWKTLYQLKSVPRTGWVDRGIPANEAESVADHSFFMMLILWIVAQGDSSLDTNKVLRLAMIHDTAEAIAGDIPPYEPEDIPSDPQARWAFFGTRKIASPENRAKKVAVEQAAARELIELLPEGIRDEWQALWDEYEAQETAEAVLVKQVDRLEVFIQSRLYARQYPDVPVHGFADMARQSIDHPLLVPIRDAFLAEMGQPL